MDSKSYPFECRILGKGGHGAMPQETVDPVVAAAQVIAVLEGVAAALDVKMLWRQTQGGTRFNIIPEQVLLRGVLVAGEKADPGCVGKLEQAGRQAAAALRAGCEMDFLQGGV